MRNSNRVENIHVLVNRYIQLINETRPNVYPIKNPEGSLELEHLLWMLVKMSNAKFVPLTSDDAWITWVQAGLYNERLIHIRFEKDITREILGRISYVYTT